MLPGGRGDSVPRRRPLITAEERLESVAAGNRLTVPPAGIAAQLHPDEVFAMELTDVPWIVVALGYLKHRTRPGIEEFAELCRVHLAGEPESVPTP